MLLFSELSSIVADSKSRLVKDLPVIHLLYDSRKQITSNGSIFFAIKSVRRNGHDYIAELYKKGIRQFVIGSEFSKLTNLFPDANFLIVNDTISALQQIASFHRQCFHYPVIGITGSNGKTIVKEWLAILLANSYRIVRSPRSFNSQLGVPLSVWQMNEEHQLGIFEAGISKVGEMELLEKVIQPDIGVLTNIGSAHDEGFQSLRDKVVEKLKLFAGSKILIFNSDNPLVLNLVKSGEYAFNTLTWGTGSDADLKILRKEISGNNTFVEINWKDKTTTLNIPFVDNASIENALTCASLLFYLGISPNEVSSKLLRLQPLQMRLEIKEGVNSSYIIDDAYNNDFAGLVTALQFLDQQKQRARKTVILSDLTEYSVKPEELYSEIASLIKGRNLDNFIGIGPELTSFKHLFPDSYIFFESADEFLKNISAELFSNEVVLVKGARVFKFERIVQWLSERVHGTVLEINLDAISHNLNYFKSLLRPETKTMVMVKAFAYGSGSAEIANLLQFHKVDYLGVAYADEGVQLRNQGISVPVMVMNPSASSFDKIVRYNLEPEIYSFKLLNELIDFLKGKDNPVKIHLKIDTGMHRLGFLSKEIEQLLPFIINNPLITIQSVFTHLAAADDCTFNDFSDSQIKEFAKVSRYIEDKLGKKVIKHVLNSAGIVRFPESQFDMVRLGVGLYGVEATGERQNQLLNVSTLKTVISQIKELEPGQTVGYSRNGRIDVPKKIATIAIGYADGYDRRFGNGGANVLVGGKLCPVIGNICMDMCMVDVTGTDAAEGDIVTLFGEIPSVRDLASGIGTIPYEIFTKVSERVKRVFYSS